VLKLAAHRELHFPEDLLYTKTHEWARIEGDLVRVGITSYAVQELEEITRVMLPNKGDKTRQGSPFGVVESYKGAFDIYAPFTGTVVEVNQEVQSGKGENYDLISRDPYGEGWLIVIAPDNLESEKKNLLSSQEYKQLVEEQL